MKDDEIVEYHPHRAIRDLDGTEPLTELAGQTFIIKNVEFFEARNYTIAKVTLDNGKAYRTTSEVLVKQLKEIAEILKQCKKVKVTLGRRKRYYTFE